MALIDKLRFHNILIQGGLPEAPAVDFADALQETFDEQIGALAQRSDVERILHHIDERFMRFEAWVELRFAQSERDAAEREARQTRLFLVGIGITLTAITLATGLIIALT